MTTEKKPRKYNVRASFTFRGTFLVEANSKDEARAKVKEHVGLVLGGDIHSTLPPEEMDWAVNAHPEKRVY